MRDSKVKIQLNSTGIREVLKSQFMMDAVMNVAEDQGDIETNFVGFDRVQVIVKTENNNAD